MKPEPDFDHLAAYRILAEMTTFVHDLEDRFPQDELPVLYNRMKVAVVEAGAHLASGFARDGLDASGVLSGQTQRDVAGKLGELRHYILTAASGFHLDEYQVKRFDDLYSRVKAALSTPAGPA